MADIGGRHLSMAVGFTDGLSIQGVRDQITGHALRSLLVDCL